MRKHRHYTVDDIGGRATFERFLIKRTVLLNIVGNIRDMNAQPITAGNLLNADRVVQILGILAVNRDNHFPGAVAAAFFFFRRYARRRPLRLFHDFLRELRIDIVFQQH